MPEEIPLRVTNPNGPRELIMIVDDDTLVTMLVERVLTGEGYRVVTAEDGYKALAIYEKYFEQVQLVISDFKMPGMDGFALFHELRGINPDAHVVITSGFLEQERLDEMMAQGVRGFIPKPLTQRKLLEKVRAILDSIYGRKNGP
jgi:two-component system, cell cycle sensor histidine kinase and response regulator CckA